jgi:hypothetical protein
LFLRSISFLRVTSARVVAFARRPDRTCLWKHTPTPSFFESVCHCADSSGSPPERANDWATRCSIFIPAAIPSTKRMAAGAPLRSGDQTGTGAIAGEGPPHAEDGGAENEAHVGVGARRQVKAIVEDRGGSTQNDSLRDEMHGDGPDHHEREARIPSPQYVEKTDHLRRSRHPRDGEADRKQHAG